MSISLEALNTSQQDFLAEYTRLVLAETWAPNCLNGSTIPPQVATADQLALAFATQKGWVTSKGYVSATGYKTAAAYLRR